MVQGMSEPPSRGPSPAQLVTSPSLVTLTSADTRVLVLADGDSPEAINDARGDLFERFFASFLHANGYNKPTRERRNVTAAGIELDITAIQRLNKQPAIVECKAQTDPVGPTQLGKFHSRLVVARYKARETQGFFVAIPRLTGPAQEQADVITANDPAFRVLTAKGLTEHLRENKDIVECPLRDALTSDDAIVITTSGLFAACLENDPITRRASRLLVWSASSAGVPTSVLDALAANSYSQGVPAVDARYTTDVVKKGRAVDHEPASVIITVTGSKSDFEYQPPASPKYFVGRESSIEQVMGFLSGQVAVLILNAKSGWGKSSLALKLEQIVCNRGGYALVVDSRTANNRRFVTDALRRAAREAAELGVLTLPANESWASLASALQTIRLSHWNRQAPIVLFFDQFENVFRDEPLTKEFRDLALGARELLGRLSVGFAWKTDDIGWIEDFPYQLRDEIKSGGILPRIEPLNPQDITALLKRLEREFGHSLTSDLSQRLREFSQGLPWLFKKLAAHILRELESGVTQERLASEGLNIKKLFDADLALLSGKEAAALRHVAKHAPMPVSDVSESISPAVIRTLIHSRLIVEVGPSLDIYWDIFRDYLNSGRIPVQDSYIIRQTPLSVARLLREVVRDGGDGDIRDIARRLKTSENALFNLSRELRLLGVTEYEPNRVRLIAEILDSTDREAELRNRVTSALRNHRAFSIFSDMTAQYGVATVDGFARSLPGAFPAVQIKATTWRTYARSFLLWLEYAGLAIRSGQRWIGSPDALGGKGQLLGGKLVRRMRTGFLHERPGPVVKVAYSITTDSGNIPSSRLKTRAIRSLTLLGALTQDSDGQIYLTRSDLFQDGELVPEILYELISVVPGVAAGLALLSVNSGAAPEDVGEAVRRSLGADWQRATKVTIGKNLRAWARHAGVQVNKVPRSSA
jgi:Restriction endonuclease